MTTLAEAEDGVRRLHARYTDSVFRQDFEAFARCFAEDGEWRISGRVFKGRAEIKEAISIILDKFIKVLITFRQPLIEVTGPGKAAGRTYIDERCAWKNGDTNIAIGRYYEHFVQVGEEWLFAWRLFENHYRGPPDMTGTFFEWPDYGAPPAMPPLDATTIDMASTRWGLPPKG